MKHRIAKLDALLPAMGSLMPWLTACACLAALWTAQAAIAEDWPTYMHDNARSGVSTESLVPGDLEQGWVYVSPAPPRRAWSNGPRWDAWASTSQVPMRDFDTAFFVTVVGDNIYFGSSVTNSVHCLEAGRGEQKWFFRTNGPVRYPPSYDSSKLYFGSDDGYAYCINADNGSFIWKHSPAGSTRVLCNNGSLITMWPIRSGTAVLDGKVYFAASLVPWENSFLCSLDTGTGSNSGAGLYKISLAGVSPAGAILASQDWLYLTQGRLYPRVYNRANGSGAGTLSGPGGGVYALLTSDGPSAGFVYGHGRNWDKSGYELTGFSDRLANHPNGKYMVVAGGYAYVVTESFGLDTVKGHRRNVVTKLSAINRGTGSTAWSVTCNKSYYSLILADDVLFAGGTGEVVAHSVTDGGVLWSQPVRGHARGLAVANGRLYVSTDNGYIYSFGNYYLPEDLNKDGVVNASDLLILTEQFLKCTDPANKLWPCEDLREQ